VYRNGVLLSRGNDYTATNGTSITLTDATITGDIIEVFASAVLAVADVYTQTQSNAAYIGKALVDAKGDILTATADDTPARLAVGSNGDTLVADSAASTGLRWQAHTEAGKNFLINGGMDIWQRGTSATGGYPTYLADRWMNYRAVAGSTFSRQVTGDTTNLPSIQYCQRLQRNSGNTATNDVIISQSIESVNSIPLAGKTVIMSFYARKGADLSSASSVMFAGIYSGTGTDQNFIAGFTGVATVVAESKTLTTTWQRFTVTGTVGATATEIGVQLGFTPTGTASTNDYIEITGVQLELGSTATTFSRAGGTIQGELAACQRYFEMITGGGGVIGQAANTTTINIVAMYKVTKRVAPTLTGLLSVVAAFIPNGGSYTNSSGSAYTFGAGMAQGVNGVWAQISGFSGITTDKFAYINTTSNIISADAEL
jgi:hypothetical protein